MEEQIRLSIPKIPAFDINYYYASDAEMYPPRVWPFHLHNELELYILLEGDVSFAVESSLYRLTPGSAIISKPNEMHNCILHTHSVHKHLCFWFEPSFSFLFEPFLSHSFGKNNLIVPSDSAKAELLLIYESLRIASLEGDTHKQFGLILSILSIFRRFIVSDSPVQALPPMLSKILEDIDENFKSIRSLSYFTDKYYISQSTLNRLFRTHLHTTPKMYLETKRLANSRVLLGVGCSVLDACVESGFPDYSNFIRLFKKRFSMTPKQYQDKAK